MKGVTTIFFLGLLLSLILTPMVRWLALRYQLVDQPGERKVHVEPIARIGGVAIVLSFYLPFLGFYFYPHMWERIFHSPLAWLFAGSLVVFVTGLLDDIYRLKPWTKLLLQVIAALIAYAGGIRISQISLFEDSTWALSWLSLPATVFWFLLIVNAINLIDGLDGLAAGVSLFVSFVLFYFSFSGEKHLLIISLGALAGVILGFLRYNFNPASIFMGDSGSYFLGYMIAGLSILGALKSPTTVAILIPVIALGLPLMDTILATIRRFFEGKSLFQPDKMHIHHRLIKKGLTHRKAVLYMYLTTIILGIFSLLIVRVRDAHAAFLLAILGITAFLMVRRLGYLEYLAIDKLIGYFYDVTDEIGLRRDRRTFLSRQIAIGKAVTPDDLWKAIVSAVELLKIHQAEIHLNGNRFRAGNHHYVWQSPEADLDSDQTDSNNLFINLPLRNGEESYGNMVLRKNLLYDPINPYTFRRVEQLRRAVVRKVEMMIK